MHLSYIQHLYIKPMACLNKKKVQRKSFRSCSEVILKGIQLRGKDRAKYHFVPFFGWVTL